MRLPLPHRESRPVGGVRAASGSFAGCGSIHVRTGRSVSRLRPVFFGLSLDYAVIPTAGRARVSRRVQPAWELKAPIDTTRVTLLALQALKRDTHAQESPLVTCFAKGFLQVRRRASRIPRCRISAVYLVVISARINLVRTAKYPGLGYDLQRKIKANSDLFGRFGTPAGIADRPLFQRTDTARRRLGTGDLER